MESEIPMDEPEKKAKAVAMGLDCSDNRQGTSLTKRLRLAHADAVSEIERDRKQPGQVSTGINGEVGVSGVLALTEEGGGHSPFAQFVVAAPPETGKTSHAVALMAAIVRTANSDDLSQPYGCLFVVDQIARTPAYFQQLLGMTV
jgi:hypothetical protein